MSQIDLLKETHQVDILSLLRRESDRMVKSPHAQGSLHPVLSGWFGYPSLPLVSLRLTHHQAEHNLEPESIAPPSSHKKLVMVFGRREGATTITFFVQTVPTLRPYHQDEPAQTPWPALCLFAALAAKDSQLPQQAGTILSAHPNLDPETVRKRRWSTMAETSLPSPKAHLGGRLLSVLHCVAMVAARLGEDKQDLKLCPLSNPGH